MKTFERYENGTFSTVHGDTVKEFPLVLHVNGREIATLIASPHDLRFLVVGFLRLQGFVNSVEDFLMLALCEDYGIANVRIKGELPEKLKPILTSGCGTGITFTLPGAENAVPSAPAVKVAPQTIFTIMEGLAKKADGYKAHGGMHSAALADGTTILLHSEDIGRHNTIDRIAGEALLKGIDLSGKILVTSGRVSTELAAKAAQLGISVIASRTSPTDQALELCEKAGITLIGYVRGGKFTLYHNAGHIDLVDSRKVAGVTAAILAGGQSSRMGSNKALLPYKGGRFIEAIYRQLSDIFTEIIVVTNTPEQYDFLPCPKVPDIYPGMGALAGVHSAVHHSGNPKTFVVACDMPYLNDDLVRTIATTPSPENGVVIPETERGVEPLHALYGKGCLSAIESTFARGERRIVDFFEEVTVTKVSGIFLRALDPGLDSFRNINTPAEYYQLRDGERNASAPGTDEEAERKASSV